MRLSVAFSIAFTIIDDVVCDEISGTEWSSSQTSSNKGVSEDADGGVVGDVAGGDGDDGPRRHLDEMAAMDCAAVHRNC